MADDTNEGYDELLREAAVRARSLLARRLVGDGGYARALGLLKGPAEALFAEEAGGPGRGNEANADRLVAWLAQRHPEVRPRPLSLFLAVGRAVQLALEGVARGRPSPPATETDDMLSTIDDARRRPQAFLRQSEELPRVAGGLFGRAALLCRFAGRSPADAAALLREIDPAIGPEQVESMLDIVEARLAECTRGA